MSKSAVILIATLMLASLTCSAADKPTEAKEQESQSSVVWDKLNPSYQRLSKKTVEFVGEENQKLLANLAYAAVVSNTCPGYPLKQDKFSAAFDAFKNTRKKGTAGDVQNFGAQLMTYYGVYVGLLSAEAALEPEFCGSAQERLNSPEGQFWNVAK